MVFGIRHRAPRLGTSYSVQVNGALNIVIENNISRRGIDLLFNPPYVDIYVWSKLYIIGGVEVAPNEKLRDALSSTAEELVRNDAAMQRSQIRLKEKQRFQIGPSLYRIQRINEDVVQALCVYGDNLGHISEFPKENVIDAIHNQLTN